MTKVQVNPVEASALSNMLFDYYQSGQSDLEFEAIVEYVSDSFIVGTKTMQKDYPYLSDFSLKKIMSIITNGFEVQYPEIQAGDMVVTRHGVNDCDVRFVEGADSGCILLVNGIQDLSYELPAQLEKFWSEWEILCKLEDRKDSSAEYYPKGGKK